MDIDHGNVHTNIPQNKKIYIFIVDKSDLLVILSF